MSNAKPTPTPWAVGYGHFSKSFGIYTAETMNNDLFQSPICIVSPIDKMDETDKANAAHIVKCVNLFDEMKDALKTAAVSIAWFKMNTQMGTAFNKIETVLKKANQ